jgi:deoxyribodipyrimidine photo-lyase
MLSAPPNWIGATPPEVSAVAAREVWLIHPWNLSALPAELPPDTVVIAIFVADFHNAWPWSDGRWRFVGTRMAELTPIRWYGSAAAIGQALSHASRVRSVAEPHLMPWLRQWAECAPAPMLFPAVDRPCNSFSQWWTRASRSLQSATQLLAPDKVTRHDDSETRL